MALVTNRGKLRQLQITYAGRARPTNYYVALVTSAATPTEDTNTLGELTQIATGNGYTSGGISVNLDDTDWDTQTEDDSGDLAEVILKDIAWTASGGNLPASGSGARWAVLTDDNATVGSREVLVAWSLGSDRTVSDGQPLTLQNLTVRAVDAS